MTLRQAISAIEQAVAHLYPAQEATAIAREVICRKCGYNFSQLVMHYDDCVEIDNFEVIVAQLAAARPVQYVTGIATFCDMDFVVREGVLIPRPETEELVNLAAESCKAAARILDVGTGSGAIAISLARMVANAYVVGVDISDTALEVARQNAMLLEADVTFVKADALGDMTHLGTFDSIVSNPPYIPHSDITAMHANVVDYEPHTALFVTDNDTLCFYRSIARNGLTMLREGGNLFFEIYEHFGAEMVAMLEDMGYHDTVVVKDIFGKERMIWSRR